MLRTFRFSLSTLACASLLIALGGGRAAAQESGTQALEQAHEQAAQGSETADAGVAAEPPAEQPVVVSTPTAGPTQTPAAAPQPEKKAEGGHHVYDMPANADEYGATATVAASHETELIGDYNQPRWTGYRRWATTRSYVRPAGTLAFEYWLESKLNLDDVHQVRHRSQFEFEYGIGHRLQFDIYLTTEQNGHHGAYTLASEKAELRYALADWGKIPLNPTLYAEFVRQNAAPDKTEFKVLFSEQFSSKFYAAANIVWEHELGDAQENEYAITLATALSIADSRFSLGGEVKFEMVDVSGARFAFDNYEVLAGPSIWWSPVDPVRIMGVALVGFETEGPPSQTVGIFEPTIIVGWEI